MKHRPEELYRSTAPYYARYRAGYPEVMFETLRERLRLDGTQRVLDLGSGPGQVAIPLAPLVERVIAVDPEPTMLEEGARLAQEGGIENIDWRLGDSYRLADMGIAELDLVTIGSSFHWMDRPALLRVLDNIVRPSGAVVVIDNWPLHLGRPPSWQTVIDKVVLKWLGASRLAVSAPYNRVEKVHEEVLRESPFCKVEILRWTWQEVHDLDSLVNLQFSQPFSSPARLGANKDAFEADLRSALAMHHLSDQFVRDMTTETIIATREWQR